MDEDDDQEIYDDGTSITNRRSVGLIKHMFEPAIQGPKPTLPSKPKPQPPKRSDVIPNGEVNISPLNNVLPKKNFPNRTRDENSNLQNGDGVVLNPELVSKFNSIKNKIESDDKNSATPPWVKPKPKEPSIKPLETKVRGVGNLPIEGLAGRVKMFEKKANDDSEIKQDNIEGESQTQNPEKSPSIAETKAAIAEKFQPKLPTFTNSGNKPPPTPTKPGGKPTSTTQTNIENKPPQTPNKPKVDSPTEVAKSPPTINTKFSSATLPGQPDELMRAIQKRKESIKMKSISEQMDEEPQLRNKKTTKSVKRKSFTRVNDGKKFYLVEISNVDSVDIPPPKPPKIPNIDVDSIVSEYKKKFVNSNENDRPNSHGFVEEDEDLYEELPDGEGDVFPPPPPPEHLTQKSSRVVSLIPEMTEDEEFDRNSEVYDEGFTPISTPAIPVRPMRANLPELPKPPKPEAEPVPEPPARVKQGIETSDNNEEDEDSGGSLYEPLDDVINEVARIEEEKSSNVTENSAEQISEKDKKKREKEEKKRLEQEKKQQEKKIKELKSKFKIDLSDLEPENSKGAGTIKEDAKGKGKDLTVKAGQRVNIICMDKRNPKGKWLVKLNDDQDAIGYVDSNNVEVDNTLIRSVMEGSAKKHSSMLDDQEEYEAVEPEQDEVYSEAL